MADKKKPNKKMSNGDIQDVDKDEVFDVGERVMPAMTSPEVEATEAAAAGRDSELRRNLAGVAVDEGAAGGMARGWKTSTTPDRKIVTFGDSSSVTGNVWLSVFAVILLFVVWFVITNPWGFPDEFKTEGLTDRDRITNCNNDEENCGRDAYSQLITSVQFPTIRDTFNVFGELLTDGFRNITLQEHTWASVWRVIRGLFWGILIGVPVGMAMGLSSRAKGFFDPIVESFRVIPPLALVALFITFFGLGDPSAWRLLTFASVFIMIIAARSGVQAANLSKVRAAYSLGASKRQVLTKVLLPNALPELFTGLRVSLGVAWGTLVAAELTGNARGLGAMIQAARGFLRLDVMVAGIIVIAVIGVLMDFFIRFLEARLIPWRGKG